MADKYRIIFEIEDFQEAGELNVNAMAEYMKQGVLVNVRIFPDSDLFDITYTTERVS